MTKTTALALGSVAAGLILAVASLLSLVGTAFAAGSVSVDSPTAGGDGAATVTLSAAAPDGSGIGSWSFDVSYNPADFSGDPTCSTVASGGDCAIKPGGVDGVVRFAGAVGGATGLTGTVEIGKVSFVTTLSPGACSDVTITIRSFTDENVADLNPTITNGQVCAQSVTPSPPLATPTATQFPTATPVSLPGISEYPVPMGGGFLLGITAGPDGALWFTEYYGSKIGRITTGGAISEYPLRTTGSVVTPNDITSGPDGALWFTEEYGLHIGRITTAGSINEYPLPENSQPEGITAGSDGALWFTDNYRNKILRITTEGGITEYPIPTANSQPHGIAAGPDGALWFTEGNGNKIGRITTAGDISEYQLASQPYGIAAGPDGALWFTERSGNKIGRITAGGVINEYSLPSANSGPQDITAGPDGALWFTESVGKIGRITVSGAIDEYTLPTANSGPEGITAGPDGALWFTERAAGKIGRIVVPLQTNLAQDAPAGATMLQPADATGFAARDLIVIGPGGPHEEYSVVSGLGSLDLAAPLQLAHTAGESIVRVANGIAPGNADCIGTVDTNDLLSVLRRAAGIAPYDHCLAAGNIRCHDAIDARDALDLLLYLAGAPPDIGDCPPVVVS